MCDIANAIQVNSQIIRKQKTMFIARYNFRGNTPKYIGMIVRSDKCRQAQSHFNFFSSDPNNFYKEASFNFTGRINETDPLSEKSYILNQFRYTDKTFEKTQLRRKLTSNHHNYVFISAKFHEHQSIDIEKFYADIKVYQLPDDEKFSNSADYTKCFFENLFGVSVRQNFCFNRECDLPINTAYSCQGNAWFRNPSARIVGGVYAEKNSWQFIVRKISSLYDCFYR